MISKGQDVSVKQEKTSNVCTVKKDVRFFTPYSSLVDNLLILQVDKNSKN